MAAPIVSGIAGLLYAKYPFQDYSGIKSIIMNSVDKIGLLSNMLVSGGRVNAYNALTLDSDQDGLKDGVETNTGIFINDNQTGSDPNNSDTDSDGMPDGWEVQHGLNPVFNDADGDPDHDGISNLSEYNQNTDPNVSNTKPLSVMPWLHLLLDE